MSKNMQAILDWVREHRPDCLGQLKDILAMERRGDHRGTAALLLLAIGFEAGREFQSKNQEMPLGTGNHYVV